MAALAASMSGSTAFGRSDVLDWRIRLGKALVVYLYSELPSVVPWLGRLVRAATWRVALAGAAAAVLLALWMLSGSATGLWSNAVVLAAATLYVPLYGALVARACLTLFGWSIHESFGDRVRRDVAGALTVYAGRCKSVDRGDIESWRDDLARLGARHEEAGLLDQMNDKYWHIPHLSIPMVALTLLVLAAIVANSSLLADMGLAVIHPYALSAIASGLALTAAAGLIRRSARALYRDALKNDLAELREQLGADTKPTTHPGTPVTVVLMRTGALMVAGGAVAVALAALL